MAATNQWLPPANLSAASAVPGWRAQFPDGTRLDVISWTMENLQPLLPPRKGLDLRQFVIDLEKKAYSRAGSKADYIQKIGISLDSFTSSGQAMTITAPICNLDVGGQDPAYTASVASNSHIKRVSSGDRLEETYQKMKSMKEMYLTRVEGLYQKCDKMLQQSEEQKNLIFHKSTFEDIIHFLKIPKNDIGPGLMENFPIYEKNIHAFLSASQPQGQKQSHAFGAHLVHPPYTSQISLQLQQPQPPRYADSVQQAYMQPHANQVQQWNMQAPANQVQRSNMQGSATQMWLPGMPILQYDSLLSLTHDVSTQRGIANILQPSSSTSAKQQEASASVQKCVAISKRNGTNIPQHRLPGMPILQYDSLLSLTRDVSTQRGIANILQPSSSTSAKQQEASASVQKGVAISKRNETNIPQHTHTQDSEDMLSTSNRQTQPNPSILQKQHEQQMPQHIQQHYMKHLWSTQQPLLLNVHKKIKHDKTQSLMHQSEQLCHVNEAKEPKVVQEYGNQSGFHQHNFSASKRQKLYGQLLNSYAPVLTYSPEKLSALSPQISYPHKSQHTFLSTPQGCEPLESTCSPSSFPSSCSPCSILSDQSVTAEGVEDRVPANPVLSNSNNIVNQQITQPTNSKSVSIATAKKEFVSPKYNWTMVPTMLKTGQGEKPINRLIRAYEILAYVFEAAEPLRTGTIGLCKKRPPDHIQLQFGAILDVGNICVGVQYSTIKALSCSISDIASVVSMSNKTAESALNLGFAAATSEFLAGMTDSVPGGKNSMLDVGVAEADKMNYDISALPLNNVVSAGNINDHANDTSKLESTATSHLRRHKAELQVSHILPKEIQEINQRLIICDEDVNLLNAVSEAQEGIVIKSSSDAALIPDLKPEEVNSINPVSEIGEGTVIKCSFSDVALSPDMKSLFTSAQMAPLLPLRLFIPVNYPKCSPVILDLIEPSNKLEDLSTKARSRFMTTLCGLSQPISLREMTNLWNSSARTVIREYAMRIGGGTFSSRYGSMQNCEHA